MRRRCKQKPSLSASEALSRDFSFQHLHNPIRALISPAKAIYGRADPLGSESKKELLDLSRHYLVLSRFGFPLF